MIEFSKNELLAIVWLGKGINSVDSLAKELRLSIPQTYVVVRGLIEKKIVVRNKGLLEFEKQPFISLFVRVLFGHENLVNNLFGKRLCFLSEIIDGPLRADVIATKCDSTLELVYKFIQDARLIGLIKKTPFGYMLNEETWPQMKEFLVELIKQDMWFDERLPVGAKIYLRNKKGVLFSLRGSFKEGVPTAFSIFGKYGIKVHLLFNYYFYPKTNLSIQDIFDHSVVIVEKENEFGLKMFICLFYLKHRSKLSNEGEVVRKIIDAFIGKKVEGYPPREEILEKCELYDIKV
jgi:hypothetical protein